MNADLKGALAHVNSSNTFFDIFEHKGEKLNRNQVIEVLEYGISKGYKTTSEISEKEVDQIINPPIVRKLIFDTISDLVGKFVYYDRKNDDDLSSDQLNEAVKDGIISVDEIIAHFSEQLKESL